MRINRELAADFNVDLFRHHTFYNKPECRIEMHLVSMQDQRVNIDGQCISFATYQSILAEYSHKYSVTGFQELAERAGFNIIRTGLDESKLFSVNYLM